MNVGQIMTKDPACCSRETSLRDVAKMMVENDCGAIPVVDGSGYPLGVVTDRDIVCRTVANGLNPLELTAADCMTEGAVTVRPDTALEECSDLLGDSQVRRALVVDGGRVVGIVAQADIARHHGDLAEELVEAVSQPSMSPSAPPQAH